MVVTVIVHAENSPFRRCCRRHPAAFYRGGPGPITPGRPDSVCLMDRARSKRKWSVTDNSLRGLSALLPRAPGIARAGAARRAGNPSIPLPGPPGHPGGFGRPTLPRPGRAARRKHRMRWAGRRPCPLHRRGSEVTIRPPQARTYRCSREHSDTRISLNGPFSVDKGTVINTLRCGPMIMSDAGCGSVPSDDAWF